MLYIFVSSTQSENVPSLTQWFFFNQNNLFFLTYCFVLKLLTVFSFYCLGSKWNKKCINKTHLSLVLTDMYEWRWKNCRCETTRERIYPHLTPLSLTCFFSKTKYVCALPPKSPDSHHTRALNLSIKMSDTKQETGFHITTCHTNYCPWEQVNLWSLYPQPPH